MEANDCPPVASNWEGLGDVTMDCEAGGEKVTTKELTNKGQLTMEIGTKYDIRDRFESIN